MLGSILSAVGTGFMSDWFHRRAEKRTFADNANLSWQMWQAQNAYNTPRAQMERFREAGLNPNLIYGQTNTSAPISVPSSRGTPPAFNALLEAQLKNMEMQNSSVAQNIEQSKQQMDLAKLSTMSNLAYQQAQIAGLELSNKAQKALLSYSAKEGLPPAVVLGELQGGVGAMIFKALKNKGFIPGITPAVKEESKQGFWSKFAYGLTHPFG